MKLTSNDALNMLEEIRKEVEKINGPKNHSVNGYY